MAPTCLLSPFPLAGPLVVVGKTALDHIAAPLIARHDEGSETAAAPNPTTMINCNSSLNRTSSGSLAIFTAILRASSFVSSLAAKRRPGGRILGD